MSHRRAGQRSGHRQPAAAAGYLRRPVDRNRPLPAVYVMTNVSINLLLVKFRQQFGLRAFTEGFLVLYVLVTFSTSSSTISAQR